MTTMALVSNNALTGMPHRGWTLANILEDGRPLSRAKAYTIRTENKTDHWEYQEADRRGVLLVAWR